MNDTSKNPSKQEKSQPIRKQRYFTPAEVARHNTAQDCWVSALGKVLNLTSLVEKFRGALTDPIVRAAGTDISHWFDPSTKDIRRCIDPLTGLEQYYTPYGRFLHVPSGLATTDAMENPFTVPWWRDEQYVIGHLTKKTRKIRIINTLLSQAEVILEVCCEETLNEIQQRYLEYNAHAASYTWKRLCQPLVMSKTLQENNIVDETDEFDSLGLPDDYYIPAIHLYFNDDLTRA